MLLYHLARLVILDNLDGVVNVAILNCYFQTLLLEEEQDVFNFKENSVILKFVRYYLVDIKLKGIPKLKTNF